MNGEWGAQIGPTVPPETVLPPPPPGVRYVKAPLIGIVIADDDLRARINRRFYWPMIVLALLSLPLLAIEFIIKPQDGSVLSWAIWIALTLIWLAFTIEFIIKIAIAECRIEYCKRNWLDIVIIVIPALRPLRAAAVARTARVFTLRGVGMKLARYVFTIVLGLEATERLLHRLGLKSRTNRTDPARMTRYQLMQEVKKLRRLTDRWDAWYEAHQAYLDKHGREPFHRPKPTMPTMVEDDEPAKDYREESPDPRSAPEPSS